MNKRAWKPGATKPTQEEVALFSELTVHQIGRLLAAGRLALKRKMKSVRSKPKPA